MFDTNKMMAGSLLFVGGIIYILGTIIGDKYGNDLIYNASVLLLGLFMIAGSYYVNQVYKSTLFSALILIAGIGTAGVGLLPQDSDIYFVFAYIGYVAFALGAIFSYKYQNKPLNYISIILGILSLVALILWISGVEIGSGITVSPIIADFPVLLWLIGFSAHIIGSQVNNH